MLRACRLLLLASLLTGGRAGANGYGDAKPLCEEAERLFATGRDAEALAKLKDALRIQQTADRWRRPYGYARWVHFRLARHLHARGEKRRAREELKRALAVRDAQEYVDERFLVSAADPFIVQNFPELSTRKLVRHPAHAAIPRAIALENGPGAFLYVAGSSGLYRVHRARGTLEVLHDQPGDSFYRFAISDDESQQLAAYERDRNLHLLGAGGERRVPRPAFVDELCFAPDGKSALVYSRGGTYGLRVHRTSLETPYGSRLLHELRGRLLHAGGRRFLYASYVTTAVRFHPHYSPLFHQVLSVRLAAGSAAPASGPSSAPAGLPAEVLHTFSAVDPRNRVHAAASPSGKRVALLVDEPAAGRRLLIVHELETGTMSARPVRHQLLGGRGRLGVRFGAGERELVLLDGSGNAPSLLRYDPASGRATPIATLPAGKEEIHGFGAIRDGVWVHRGDTLLLVGGAARHRSLDLRRLSRAPRPEWAGASYCYVDPDQCYIGIEKGAGRYFMRVDLGAR
jgi:hypothetical protein